MSTNLKIEHVMTKSFKTTDGKVFTDILIAQNHQKALDEKAVKDEKNNKVKTELKDALNKLVLIAGDCDDNFVSNVKSYAEKVLKDEWEADHYESQYYNSNC